MIGDDQRSHTAAVVNQAVRAQSHVEHALGGAVPDGVVQQVARQLAQCPLVGMHPHRLGRQLQPEIKVPLPHQRRGIQCHLPHRGGPVGQRHGRHIGTGL